MGGDGLEYATRIAILKDTLPGARRRGGEVAVAVGLSGGAQSGGGTVATHLPFWYIPQRRSTIGLRLPHLR